MTLQPGQTILNGKYHILKLIGEGGMARVWLAEELTFGGRKVAIKEPRADLPPDLAQEVRLRYQREVQVCAALEQARVPHIVRAITAEPHDDRLLLVMEYMPGGDLASLLKQHPDSLPVERAVEIALDLLRALQGVHGHELEIVHRDIKPSNVLFDEQGRAHLADFGLAQLAGMSGRSQLRGGQHPGSPMYMAPEQSRGPDMLLPAADLYALGCVLFEMLTGKRYKRVRPGTQANSLGREVPGWLDGILARALAEDPWDRYQEAAEMAAALTGSKKQDQRTEEEHKRQSVPPWVWAVVAVLLLAMGMGLGLTLLDGGKGTPTPIASTRAADVVPSPAATTTPTSAAISAGHTAIPARDTPMPTSTSTSRPTEVPAPMSTPTPHPTDTPMPTNTPTPNPADTPVPTNTPSALDTPTPSSVPPPCTTIGDTWIRPPDSMEMVCIPAGQFVMGSRSEEIDEVLAGCNVCRVESYTDELPQHVVYLDAFWIDRTEVTSAQYRKCVEAGACPLPGGCDSGEPTYGVPSREEHPMVCLSRDEAQAYASWVGGRLPTEAEWEKAARGTDGRMYPWGNTFDGSRLNFCDRNCTFDWKDDGADDGYAYTAPVGSYPSGASPYGLFDMAGNAWEWVADTYAAEYYAESPSHNPPGPVVGEHWVMRGGSYDSGLRHVRCAKRWRDFRRLGNVGFRVAVESGG